MNTLFDVITKTFDFEMFLYFHGWIYLSPFNLYENEKAIGRYLRNSKGQNIYIKIVASNSEKYTNLKVNSPESGEINTKDKAALKMQIDRIFMLGTNFSAFHNLCKKEPSLKYVYKNNCKGMLRSPSAFEDLIKTVCTTNCDWRNTKKMCATLCSLNGGNFPSPKDILKYSPEKLSISSHFFNLFAG
jgi:3-methyladenine DNA glycosylase/8-oxoguanine DNA glycosylase